MRKQARRDAGDSASDVSAVAEGRMEKVWDYI